MLNSDWWRQSKQVLYRKKKCNKILKQKKKYSNQLLQYFIAKTTQQEV